MQQQQQQNDTRPPTYTIHKNKLTIDKRLKYKSHHKNSRGEDRQENLRYSMHQYFTHISPRARDIKERIMKWDYIKLKSFCMAKENMNKMKRQSIIWENHMPVIPWTRVWLPKYTKNSHDSTPGRQRIQLKNGQRTRTDISPKRTYRGPIDTWKNAQHH